jgi:hypothetical protein
LFWLKQRSSKNKKVQIRAETVVVSIGSEIGKGVNYEINLIEFEKFLRLVLPHARSPWSALEPALTAVRGATRLTK